MPTIDRVVLGAVVPIPTLPVEARVIRSVPALFLNLRDSEAPIPWALDRIKNLESIELRENSSKEAVAVELYISTLGENDAPLVKVQAPVMD